MEKGLFQSGDKSHKWKGNNVSYQSLHRWVVFHRGTPKKCEICQTVQAKYFDWANKSGEYKRELNDFIRVCRKCHMKYDKKNNHQSKREYNKIRGYKF